MNWGLNVKVEPYGKNPLSAGLGQNGRKVSRLLPNARAERSFRF